MLIGTPTLITYCVLLVWGDLHCEKGFIEHYDSLIIHWLLKNKELQYMQIYAHSEIQIPYTEKCVLNVLNLCWCINGAQLSSTE